MKKNKKVIIDTPEKKAQIDSIADRMQKATSTSVTLNDRMKKGEILTEEEIEDLVEATESMEKIAKELDDFYDKYGIEKN